jgi:hypothetical protein
MNNVISDYQKWKQQGEDLRVQAKQAMESRFRELLAEAVKIAEEYRSDFGGSLKPAPPVTTFRYKAHGKAKAKKAAKPKSPGPKAPDPKAPDSRAPGSKAPAKAAPREEPTPQKPDAKPDPKIAGLQKRLATAKKKLDEAKTAGKPTRVLEDKIYEIEDELRLAGQAQ